MENWLKNGVAVESRDGAKRGILLEEDGGSWSLEAGAERWNGQSADWITEHWRPLAASVQTLVVDDAWYAKLDAGIRFAVRVLHAAGVPTIECCEGGPGHAFDRPTIDLDGTDTPDGFVALSALVRYGLSVRDVSIVWLVSNGLPHDRRWRITLWKACPDRADEKPIFVHGHVTYG